MAERGVRRLRFDYSPAADESVVGILGQACHCHRLRRTSTVLAGAHLRLGDASDVQTLSEDGIARLQRALRCEGHDLASRTFRLSKYRKGHILVGDLELPVGALARSRRRIGPLSLTAEPHHRMAWLQRLLPHCPVSLERLVDACPECGPLGWNRTRGVAACDKCGKPVPQSSEPPVAPDAADDYRLFAALLSHETASFRTAQRLLPAPLRATSRQALVETALLAGVLATLPDLPHLRLQDIAAMDPAKLAPVVVTGTAMLRSWPQSIRKFVDATGIEHGGDVAAFYRLRSNLRRIGKASVGSPVDLMAIAFPRLDGRIIDSMAVKSDYYTATETMTRLWADTSQLANLRESGAIPTQKLPSLARVRARYQVDAVERLRGLLRASIGPEALASRWRMPVYAVAQLAVAELLAIEDDVGVRVLRGAQIVEASVVLFEAAIRRGARDAPSAKDPQPIGSVLAAFEGEKPWATVIGAMLDGTVPFQLVDDAISSRSIIVSRRDVIEFVRAVAPTGPGMSSGAFDLSVTSLRDAQEILADGWNEAIAAMRESGMTIVPKGHGKGVNSGHLRELASVRASTFEISQVNGLASMAVVRRLERLGERRYLGGWSRRSVTARGLLPSPRH